MRFFLTALCLIALLSAGCTPNGDTYNTTNQYYYPPSDTTGQHGMGSPYVHILSPESGSTINLNYSWLQLPANYSGRCRWAFYVDTVITARVYVNLPGGARTARVYLKNTSNSEFYTYGSELHPLTDHFDVEIFSRRNYWDFNSPDSPTGYTFYVQGTAIDSSNWISESISFWIAPQTNNTPNQAPSAPVLDTVIQYDNSSSLQVRWCHQSPTVDYVLVSRIADGETTPTIDSLYSGTDYEYVDRYYPATRYTFQVIDGNSFGRSPVSNSISFTTRDMQPPYSLRVVSNVSHRADLEWSNPFRMCDSILVSRHDTSSAWSTIQSLPVTANNYPRYNYQDTTAVSQTIYFYRIGAALRGNVLWSVDSVGVWIQ